MTEPQKPQEPQAGHLTAAEAAALLDVSTDTIYRHGHTLGRKVLGRWRIDREAIANATAGNPSGTTP